MRLLTRSEYAPLAELMPGVAFAGGLRFAPAHHLYAFDGTGKSALRSLLTPALDKTCLLADKSRARWFLSVAYSRVHLPPEEPCHNSEVFWRQTPVPENGSFAPPRLESPPEDWKPPRMPPGPFVLISPTGRRPEESWVPSHWHEVFAALHDGSAPPCAVSTGSLPWQVQHAQSLAAGFGTAAHWLCGPTSIREFLWLCSRARLVISVDNAAGHLAAAFGVPSVTLFGPGNLTRSFLPSHLACAIQAGSAKDGLRRISQIPVAPVTKAALDALEH